MSYHFELRENEGGELKPTVVFTDCDEDGWPCGDPDDEVVGGEDWHEREEVAA